MSQDANEKNICRLPEYAANMKPVIPDYAWIIFGIRVINRHY